ncbi:homeodomain-interacting protein kinase 1-like [Amphiprion ocellaris]|uniref:homeodomain-interacting protein kinase 1-like n=1 Tax=Amphiprion ocellaris TaxID=80972 RepID=UPI0024111D39|nr:homeodomain-interacting protein kinase 1-like [Amphiprion ocellaris]
MAKNLSIRKGNTLGTCHVVEDILGEGSFGVVAKCRNTETQKSVAVKVNKGQEGVLQQAIGEIAVLKRMRCLDRDICNVVQWDGFFFDKENICITFELLDMSLRDYMKEQDRGFTVGELKPILYQLATALASLHSIGITHMDLKPDNIMVDRSHQPLKVKLIDFGLARPVSALHQGDCMGTLFYCAPEMLLGVPFDESIDIWALGQVMAELAMGCWLYPGDTHYDMLRYIVETQGQPPDDLLDNGLYTSDYFYPQDNSSSRWTFKTPEDVYHEHGFCASETRSVTLKSLDEIEQNMKQDADHHRDQKMFISLIKSMLTLDVSNRINAQQVLDHEFFAASIPQSPSRDAGTQLTHIDNQQHGSFNVQHSVPSRAAVSLEEHVNLNFQHPVLTSWQESEDFSVQLPTTPVAVTSPKNCVDTGLPKVSGIEMIPTGDADVKITHTDEVLHPTLSSTATSLEQSSEADTRTEVKTKKKSLWKRIKRRITKAFHKYILCGSVSPSPTSPP